jgi:hypothetical protein
MELGHVGPKEHDLLCEISLLGRRLEEYGVDLSALAGDTNDFTIASLTAKRDAMATLLERIKKGYKASYDRGREYADAEHRAAMLSARRRWVAAAVFAALAGLAVYSVNKSEAKDDQCAATCPAERP